MNVATMTKSIIDNKDQVVTAKSSSELYRPYALTMYEQKKEQQKKDIHAEIRRVYDQNIVLN